MPLDAQERDAIAEDLFELSRRAKDAAQKLTHEPEISVAGVLMTVRVVQFADTILVKLAAEGQD